MSREYNLSTLPTALAKLIGGPPPAYQRCWKAAADGLLPMTYRRSGRIYYLDEDLPAIAYTLGLDPAPAPEPAPSADAAQPVNPPPKPAKTAKATKAA